MCILFDGIANARGHAGVAISGVAGSSALLRRKISLGAFANVVSCRSTWYAYHVCKTHCLEGQSPVAAEGSAPFGPHAAGLRVNGALIEEPVERHRGSLAILWNIQRTRGPRRHCFCRSVTTTAAATASSRRAGVVVHPAASGCIIFLHSCGNCAPLAHSIVYDTARIRKEAYSIRTRSPLSFELISIKICIRIDIEIEIPILIVWELNRDRWSIKVKRFRIEKINGYFWITFDATFCALILCWCH